MSAAAAPLHGLRILTIEAFGAAPFASMYLANLGAEVIKIENRGQGGDPSRSMGPHLLGEGDSQYFQTFNLNKKSCTVDLKHAARPADPASAGRLRRRDHEQSAR